ncbi:MAG: hypothetical protein WC975_04315 [Phycisphaerae bacterium]
MTILGILLIVAVAVGFILFIIGLIMLFKRSRVSSEPLPTEESRPDNVDERKRILEMLAEGKITNADADRLLSESSAENTAREKTSSLHYRRGVNWPRWVAGFVLLLLGFGLLLFPFLVYYRRSVSHDNIIVAAGHSQPFKPGLSSSYVHPWGTTMPVFQSQSIHKTGRQTIIAPSILFMMIPVAVAIMIFWFWMLIDCIRRPVEMFPGLFSSSPPGTGVKIFWLFLIFFFHIIPTIVYYFVVYRNPYTVMPKLQT